MKIISQEMLLEMAHSQESRWRASAATSKRLPLTEFTKLAHDESELVRQAVAANKLITQQLAEKLSEDPNHMVREALARNDACPPAVLMRLAQDKERIVRESVKENPPLRAYLEELAQQLYDEEDVRGEHFELLLRLGIQLHSEAKGGSHHGVV